MSPPSHKKIHTQFSCLFFSLPPIFFLFFFNNIPDTSLWNRFTSLQQKSCSHLRSNILRCPHTWNIQAVKASIYFKMTISWEWSQCLHIAMHWTIIRNSEKASEFKKLFFPPWIFKFRTLTWESLICLTPVMPVSLFNLYCQLLWLLLFPEALKDLLRLSRHQLWKQSKLFTAS